MGEIVTLSAFTSVSSGRWPTEFIGFSRSSYKEMFGTLKQPKMLKEAEEFFDKHPRCNYAVMSIDYIDIRKG